MATPFQRDLKKLGRHLVQIKRRAGMEDIFGFVVDSSTEVLLLHSFESEPFCLNGYDVIRQSDIRYYCFFDDPRYWRFRALKTLKVRPVKPRNISLGSIREVLASVSLIYPCLSADREERDRPTSYVGPLVRLSERTFTMEDTDYYGQFTGPRRLRYEDVTRICFDGGYLTASAMTATIAAKRTQPKASRPASRRKKPSHRL